jgi:rRNA-processing protein FCF1
VCNVFVDTSSILYGFENGKNVFRSIAEQFPGCKPYVSKGIIRELTKISNNKGKKGVSAKVSLAEIKAARIGIYKSNASGDAWLLSLRLSNECCKVITNDSVLAKKLKSLGANVLKLNKNGILRHI